MKGHLLMSQKERQRFLVLDRVDKGELRPCDAARTLRISYRHFQRLLIRYREQGEAGLVHALRGRAGTRRSDPELKDTVLETYRQRYSDFGPTLASETLAKRDGLAVHPETLRLWLSEKGYWTVKKRRVRHRSRRKRRACFGELLQFDGSHHDWFEGRGPKCCLITLVDDATGRTFLLFAADEGTFAVMAAVHGWIKLYGIPQALYTDRLKTYLTDREPTAEEQLAGQEPLTQFGRACDALGIRIIAARSAQAKGRVENKHGLTQDRLVKEMRLAGIDNIADANEFLKTWLPQINERFAIEPADAADAHRPVPAGLDLRGIFCRHERRIVSNDWVVRYKNRYLQIRRQPDLPPSSSAVTVREWEDATLEVWFKDRRLRCDLLPERPMRTTKAKPTEAPRARVAVVSQHGPFGPKRGYDTNPTKQVVEDTAAHYLGQPTELVKAYRSADG